jgi:hypothetical protein
MKRLAAFEVAQKIRDLVFNSISGGRRIDVGVGLLRDTDLTRITKPFVLITLVEATKRVAQIKPKSHNLPVVFKGDKRKGSPVVV